ncbi:chaperone modulator CbpM [Maribacter halichondriae]|uniref:chaperone modulator CbpM n=1 Tax=Maribacter halichondriae TaxID=2980554 RepID=UPI0023597D8C|nr:chaperone modulator CbpM [Maribacter sp. Hal144]
MNLEDLITITDFCKSYQISKAMIVEFKEFGLVNIIENKNTLYMPLTELPKAEKILRLHSELDINLEGIEVITQLLNRMEEMQKEMTRLQNRLRLYE